MRRDLFTRDRDDITIGDRVASMIAGGLFAVAFIIAAVVESVWGDDDL
jgi:hypothetical protein